MSVYEALSLVIQSIMGVLALLTFVAVVVTSVIMLLTYLREKK